MGVIWYFILVFIFITVMANAQPLICSMAISISSLEKYLLKSSAQFLIGLLFVVATVLYIFWTLTPYLIHDDISPILWVV